MKFFFLKSSRPKVLAQTPAQTLRVTRLVLTPPLVLPMSPGLPGLFKFSPDHMERRLWGRESILSAIILLSS